MKKFFALMLACIMSMSLMIPAFAAGEETDELAVEIESTLQDVEVTVAMADEAGIVLNPYQQTVKMKGDLSAPAEANDTGTVDKSDQIISPIVYMYNETQTDLKISAKVKGTPTTGVTLASSAISSMKTKPTDKQIFAYVGFGSVALGKVTKTGSGNSATYSVATADVPTFNEYNAKSVDTILVSTEEVSKDVMTLPAAQPNATTPQYNAMAFQIKGDMVKMPEEMWTADDGVSVTVTLTLTPTAIETE